VLRVAGQLEDAATQREDAALGVADDEVLDAINEASK
jgi:hypothetical protein